MKTIPKPIRACALQYIRYKIKSSENYDGAEFKFKELRDNDWRWAFLEMYWQPIWKWLLWLEMNKLRCEKSNIDNFNKMLLEDEERPVGTVQRWQSVIAEFIRESENGFSSQVVERLNQSTVGSPQSAVDSLQSTVSNPQSAISSQQSAVYSPELIEKSKNNLASRVQKDSDMEDDIVQVEAEPVKIEIEKYASIDDSNINVAIGAHLVNIQNEHTRRNYSNHIKEFFKIFQVHPKEITNAMIILYMQRLKELGNSVSTIRTKIAAMSGLYDYLCKPQGASIDPLVKYNPFEAIQTPRVEPYSKSKKITLSQAWQILEVIDQSEAIGARDYACLLWLLLTGRRLNEILPLRRDNLIFIDRNKINYEYKPEKDRYEESSAIELLPPPVWKALIGYWQCSERQLGGNDPLFLSASNNGKNGKSPLSDTAIRQDLNYYAGMAGIDPADVQPHSFRHCFAQVLYKAGVDIRKIKQKLGHKRLTTTEIYLEKLKVNDDDAWKKFMITISDDVEGNGAETGADIIDQLDSEMDRVWE